MSAPHPALRVFHLQAEQFSELPGLPEQLPPQGFLWVGMGREHFAQHLPRLQADLTRWGLGPLVDLHASDLLNAQLRSSFDATSWYDLLVFRRLVRPHTGPAHHDAVANAPPPDPAIDLDLSVAERTRQTLASIDTAAVGFAVFDQMLITVHPNDCAVREFFAQRLAALKPGGNTAIGAPGNGGATSIGDLRGARLPSSPADLMLRMVNHMVDSYLELRRLLSRQLADLQRQLFDPHSRFQDWHLLLDSRNSLYLLEDICEDQSAAVQEWLDALQEWPAAEGKAAQRERELLRVRSRDLLEHVERVLSHVHRLQQSSEAAVQMHFSALGHRTNDIMRTLTVITAVFLPLNLITGFFGMNFDGLPLIHSGTGVWIAVALMGLISAVLGGFFWRRRYLGSSGSKPRA